MKSFFQEFCDKIVTLDPTIRFAGIADEDGHLVATADRKGLKPIMSPEERAQYAITAATRQFTRLRWEYQPGSELFIVYNDERDTRTRAFPGLMTRSFVVKINRLFRF